MIEDYYNFPMDSDFEQSGHTSATGRIRFAKSTTPRNSVSQNRPHRVSTHRDNPFRKIDHTAYLLRLAPAGLKRRCRECANQPTVGPYLRIARRSMFS